MYEMKCKDLFCSDSIFPTFLMNLPFYRLYHEFIAVFLKPVHNICIFLGTLVKFTQTTGDIFFNIVSISVTSFIVFSL